MSATWGKKLKITVFGESHSEGIGVVIDGVPAGVKLDFDAIKAEMARRAPNGGEFSTPRKEGDEFVLPRGIVPFKRPVGTEFFELVDVIAHFLNELTRSHHWMSLQFWRIIRYSISYSISPVSPFFPLFCHSPYS